MTSGDISGGVLPRLVLASASPRRADVLRQLGLESEVIPADIDESYVPGERPEQHVERLAVLKAEAVALDRPGALVVAGDTVVVNSGRVLAKPTDRADALAMLVSLSGGEHEVLSAMALAGPHGVVSAVTRTTVRMRSFDEEMAAAYVETGEPMDKAGAYGIQGQGAALVERIDGDYYSVVGFPVTSFLDLLDRAGWRFEFGALTRRGS